MNPDEMDQIEDESPYKTERSVPRWFVALLVVVLGYVGVAAYRSAPDLEHVKQAILLRLYPDDHVPQPHEFTVMVNGTRSALSCVVGLEGEGEGWCSDKTHTVDMLPGDTFVVESSALGPCERASVSLAYEPETSFTTTAPPGYVRIAALDTTLRGLQVYMYRDRERVDWTGRTCGMND